MASDLNFIIFSAPWCGQCKLLKPKVDKYVESNNIKIYRVEEGSYNSEALMDRFNIEFYPTLVVVEGNSHKKIVGYDKIVQYLNS